MKAMTAAVAGLLLAMAALVWPQSAQVDAARIDPHFGRGVNEKFCGTSPSRIAATAANAQGGKQTQHLNGGDGAAQRVLLHEVAVSRAADRLGRGD